MPTSSLLLLAALLFRDAPAPARSLIRVGAVRQPAATPLDTIGWVVGRWTTTEPGQKGDSIRVVMECQWSTTRNAILFTVTTTPASTGKTSPYYDGAYFSDPEHNAFGSWQVDNHGNVGHATVVITSKGWEQTTHIVHPDGKFHETKTTLERTGADAFRLVGSFRPAGGEKWLPAIDQIYRRVR
jgi:hypothetical protein